MSPSLHVPNPNPCLLTITFIHAQKRGYIGTGTYRDELRNKMKEALLSFANHRSIWSARSDGPAVYMFRTEVTEDNVAKWALDKSAKLSMKERPLHTISQQTLPGSTLSPQVFTDV